MYHRCPHIQWAGLRLRCTLRRGLEEVSDGRGELSRGETKHPGSGGAHGKALLTASFVLAVMWFPVWLVAYVLFCIFCLISGAFLACGICSVFWGTVSASWFVCGTYFISVFRLISGS